MVTVTDIQAHVAAAYDRLNAPAWPDYSQIPLRQATRNLHPGPTMPREEEYSRVTDPERYRIVYLRARVWTDQLGAVPGITVEPLAPAPLDDEGRLGRLDRGVRITSARPGTLPLLLLERDAPPRDSRQAGAGGTIPVLHISVAEPTIDIEMLPLRGCDACNSGSDDLLLAIHEAIGHVIVARS